MKIQFTAAQHALFERIPPHEQLSLAFDEADEALLLRMFGDRETARACVVKIQHAPPEHKLLFCMQMQIYDRLSKKEATCA